MSDTSVRIAENLAAIRGSIAEAARRVGRSADEITLVAVTKYVGEAEVRALAAAGCLDIGESRPQELWAKVAALADLPIRWHLVGHLQRNKIRRTLPLVSMIHSLDSVRLLEAIDHAAAESGKMTPALLEVNISANRAKHGLAPAEVAPLVEQLPAFPHVAVRGLMAMAGHEGDAHAARRDFAALRELREQLRGQCAPQVTLDHLSMGMSGDYEVAVEEGATIVRIGSALFAGLS